MGESKAARVVEALRDKQQSQLRYGGSVRLGRVLRHVGSRGLPCLRSAGRRVECADDLVLECPVPLAQQGVRPSLDAACLHHVVLAAAVPAGEIWRAPFPRSGHVMMRDSLRNWRLAAAGRANRTGDGEGGPRGRRASREPPSRSPTQSSSPCAGNTKQHVGTWRVCRGAHGQGRRGAPLGSPLRGHARNTEGRVLPAGAPGPALHEAPGGCEVLRGPRQVSVRGQDFADELSAKGLRQLAPPQRLQLIPHDQLVSRQLPLPPLPRSPRLLGHDLQGAAGGRGDRCWCPGQTWLPRTACVCACTSAAEAMVMRGGSEPDRGKGRGRTEGEGEGEHGSERGGGRWTGGGRGTGDVCGR